MGDLAATSSMGNNPVINVEIYNDGTTRNGTNITAHIGLCLKGMRWESDWWGYGVNVSWGWYDRWGSWIQGDDIVFKSNSETCWNDTWQWRTFTVDTGGYDAGSIRASFCVYPNTGNWGNGVDVWFGYGTGYTNPTRGTVTLSPTQSGALNNRFEALNINWSGYSNGSGNNIDHYEIWRREYNEGTGWRKRSGLAEVWSNAAYGSFVWSGLPRYPMYYIKNKATGRYLDVADGNLSNGAFINTYPFNGTIGQRFSLEPIIGNVKYMHIDDSFRHFVNVSGGSTANSTRILVWYYVTNNEAKFDFVSNSDGTYTIVPQHATDKCLDEDVNNHQVVIYTKKASDNQKWILEDASDAWRNLEHQINVVALGTVADTWSDTETYAWAGIKNDRPTGPTGLSATPNLVNISQAITLRWTASSDSQLRTSNTYEIEFERSRNGGAFAKVGNSVYSNTNALTNYTGHNTYAQPGDLFRFRVRAYDFFDVVSGWSDYGSFEIQKSGLNYLSNGTWKGHYVYVVINGVWTMCEVYTVKNNQWTQCVMA